MAKHEFMNEDPSYALWLLLIQTNKAIRIARQEELDRIGISVSDAGVLYYAAKLGKEATPAEISRCLSKLPHGVSTVISKLEQEGLVQKINDLSRKNMVRVALTERGKEIQQKAKKRETIHEIALSLSKEEFEQLMGLLQKLRNEALDRIRLRKKLEYLGYEE
jgi:DNA-binding MarR family transcriptional regulator